jgi:hypothetical protein
MLLSEQCHAPQNKIDGWCLVSDDVVTIDLSYPLSRADLQQMAREGRDYGKLFGLTFPSCMQQKKQPVAQLRRIEF